MSSSWSHHLKYFNSTVSFPVHFLSGLGVLSLFICCHVFVGLTSMEIKTEVDSDAVTECSHDDSPAAGMLGFSESLSNSQ